MRLICLTLALCLLLSSAVAETATATDLPEVNVRLENAGLELMGHRVAYPRLAGMEDEALQALINRRIEEAAGAAEWTARLSGALTLENKLQCGWSAEILGSVLSCVFTRTGPLRTARYEEEASSLLVSLTTGEAYTLGSLFAEAESGAEALNEALWEIAATLSPMLPAADLSPAPEAFALTQGGVVLYYPSERFQTLAGHAGRLRLSFAELGPALLDTSADGVLAISGLVPEREEAAALIAQAVEKGMLPGVPAALGDPVAELTAAYGLAIDPDYYDGGRYVTLEDGLFHGVLVMTDRLYEKDLSQSLVNGLRADAFSLWGLHTGLTAVAQWRELLGEPDATAQVTPAQAEAMRLAPGQSDYYHFGGHTLRLHADEEGVLRTIIIR